MCWVLTALNCEPTDKNESDNPQWRSIPSLDTDRELNKGSRNHSKVMHIPVPKGPPEYVRHNNRKIGLTSKPFQLWGTHQPRVPPRESPGAFIFV